jgi:hypothetical protein
MAPYIVVNKTVIAFTAVALTILAVKTMMAEARDLSSTSTGGYH